MSDRDKLARILFDGFNKFQIVGTAHVHDLADAIIAAGWKKADEEPIPEPLDKVIQDRTKAAFEAWNSSHY